MVSETEELRETITRHEAVFVRIGEAFDITPLILIANAENNEENYAEILARMVEKIMKKNNK